VTLYYCLAINKETGMRYCSIRNKGSKIGHLITLKETYPDAHCKVIESSDDPGAEMYQWIISIGLDKEEFDALKNEILRNWPC
jgi:hypothetical protein